MPSRDFIAGLFLLDPFVLAAQGGADGLLALRKIMPEGFFESEYFHHHYRYTDVCDELRFVVPLDHDWSVHVFVEREGRAAPFTPRDQARLGALTPLVTSFVRARCRWLERLSSCDRNGTALTIDLHARIAALGDGLLSPRECEVVEWMLKGHSAKSIGEILHIEEGTVTNHKRSIYSKLDVHSMAQLFDLFIRSLTTTRSA